MSQSISKPRMEAASDQAVLVPKLASVTKSIRQLMGIKLASCGIVAGQEQLLFVLLERGPVPVVQAAKELGVRPSTISKMVDNCVRKEWVARHPDVSDSRRVLLSITEFGVATAKAAQKIVADVEKELVPHLPDCKTSILVTKSLAEVLDKRLSRLR